MNHFEDISQSEWKLLRVIWTLGSATSTEIINELQKETDWDDSTIKTLLRRLNSKGYLKVDDSKRPYSYSAMYSEIDGNKQVVNTFFERICNMHKGEVIYDLLDKTEVSKTDIDSIIGLLEEKKSTAPDKVECNCVRRVKNE